MARTRLGERLYRLLLRLYPRDFSEEYSGEMLLLYRDRARDESRARLWLALAADVARTAPREQLSTLAQDLRHAWRTWRQTPVLALAAVATLALGVGANTAVFSVVHGVLLRPLPYPDADRLVEVFEDNTRAGGGPFFRVSLLNYLTWADRARSFDALAAFGSRDFTFAGSGDPERILGSAVTASLFDVLRVAPLVGRPFTDADEQPGAAPVALIAESLWRRGFGSDPSILRRSIVLSGTPHQIVGVVPPAFRELGRTQIGAAGAAQVFVPLTRDTTQSRGNHTLRVVGRLSPEISLEDGRNEMHRLAAGLEAEFPATNRQWGARIERLHDAMFDPRVRASLLVLLGAVGLVLLIACANVANLLLARAASRQRELALRTALGARPARLARQLLTESAALALVSGGCGCAAAVASIQTLRTLIPATVPRVDEVGLDGTVLGFGLLLTLACGVFFGIVPAHRAARAAPLFALAHNSRGVVGPSAHVWRHGLVAAQTALATMLVAAATLLLQSLVRLQQLPLGFEPAGVTVVRLSLPTARYPDSAARLAFQQSLLGSLEALPFVRAAGLMTSAPFAPGVRRSVAPRDAAAISAAPDAAVAAVEQVISPDLFRALGVGVLAGRPFGPQDRPDSPLVAIVSEGLARRLWRTGGALGQVLDVDGRRHNVVGVVEDVRGTEGTARGGSLDRDPGAVLYLSSAQFPQNTITLVLRADAGLEALAPSIRTAIRAIDPSQPITDARPLDDWIAESVAAPRLTTTLAGAFALAALLLTAVGIYGVVSYAAGLRTREIGVRMALGAARRSVVALVLQGGMTWAGGGIVLGLCGAWAVGRALASQLPAVSGGDPLTFAVVGTALAATALLACAIPAARAARVDPLIALRHE